MFQMFDLKKGQLTKNNILALIMHFKNLEH